MKVASFFLVLALLLSSCNKAKGTDADLLAMAKETGSLIWFKNDAAILDKSAGSAHPQPQLRTGYNSTAASMLDADYRVQEGITFPDGSLIVKELYDGGTIDRWAILYKQSSNENADLNGWVWGYINGNESVAAPSEDKGQSCITCHSQAGNIDMTLMNKFYP
ncbi:cytochrome P460 family protein [bacterium AH-315-B15]|nr:cytochrome P460 family protein [bacterium AH-315-B15]